MNTTTAVFAACLFAGIPIAHADTQAFNNSGLEYPLVPHAYGLDNPPTYEFFMDPGALYVTASPAANAAGTATGPNFELELEYFVTSSTQINVEFFSPPSGVNNPDNLELAFSPNTASTPGAPPLTQLPVYFNPGDTVDAGDFSPLIPGTYHGTVSNYSEPGGRQPYMADEVILGWRYDDPADGKRYGWVRLTWTEDVPFTRHWGGPLFLVDTYQPTAWGFADEADEPAVVTIPACPSDLDGNGTLNIDDIDAFVTAFLAGDLSVDFDGNGTLNVDDIDAFVAAFLAGC